MRCGWDVSAFVCFVFGILCLALLRGSGVSEHKKNPTQTLKHSKGKPVAVLNHNKPAFYVIAPKLFGQIRELIENQELRAIAKQRLKSRSKAIRVTLDDL